MVSGRSQNTIDELLNAASITCGSIFSGYLGVKLAVADASALNYLSLFATFTYAIFVVLLIYRLSQEIVSGASRYWLIELLALAVAIFGLSQNATHVGIDMGVVFCVLAAWSIVPMIALLFRMFPRKKKSDV